MQNLSELFMSLQHLCPAADWFLNLKIRWCLKVTCLLCNLSFLAVLEMYNNTTTVTLPPTFSRCSKMASAMHHHYTVIFHLQHCNITLVCISSNAIACGIKQPKAVTKFLRCIATGEKKVDGALPMPPPQSDFFIYLPWQVHFEHPSEVQCRCLMPMHPPFRLIVIYILFVACRSTLMWHLWQ